MQFRHSGQMMLPDGHRMRVEVLDHVQSGLAGNLLIAGLTDGGPVPQSAR
jgi:hypothetical protein